IASSLKRQSGVRTGGQDFVFLVNPDISEKVMSELTEFLDVPDHAIQLPITQARISAALPEGMPFGRVLGRLRLSSGWIVEWDQWPSGYVYGQNLAFQPPLIKRVLKSAEFGAGLRAYAKDTRDPLDSTYYRDTFGYGVDDRQNGVVLQLKGSGGAYVVPAGY
ncbi:unnamed protein product, partial [Phaeothamnion confervicola]